MKKKIVMLMLVVCLGMITVTGCDNTSLDEGKKTQNHPNISGEMNNTENTNISDFGNTTDAADIMDKADIMGTVTEFSDTGCTVVKGSVSDTEAKMAAEGVDTGKMETVSVIYSNNTELQIANSSVTSISLENSTKSELKKQSVVYLYGTYQNDGVFQATKVIIDRFQN